MCRRNNGFFLVEMLLSLSAWLVIAMVFFPLIMGLINRTIQLHQEYDGTQLLYETLQTAKKEQRVPVHEIIKINQTVYEVYQDSVRSGRLEVCVKYEDILKNEYKKCEIFE
ncbi:type II secretion system protein [Cytobacillus dafuensis]|uniref:Type II secretion system protein n=1 Tax=Cytobacillus dafuensis TaxID=1742359 RepID=A0A5B8ZAT0_CYTDA|nr:type II secretion system protein [Cytobacillus dafuensis]QED48616.1 type II secretion system protein [Cytobacillus dafuensis]